MNFKRISAAGLAVAMTASTAAFAAETTHPGARVRPMLISANPFAGSFNKVLVLNGEELTGYTYTKETPGSWETEEVSVELANIANAPTGYVPLRAVAQADHGSASWYKDENQSFFHFNGVSIVVDFSDMSISMNDEKVEEAAALIHEGVTYVPVSVLEKVEGVTVTDTSTDEVESYEITTPNGTPIMKLAYQLMETAGLGANMKNSPEELEQFWGEAHGFKAEFMTEGVVFTGMMTTPDTLAVGKVAEGKLEDLKAAFESYRKQQADTFSWYLSQNLPKVENAKFVTEGDWFMFIIAESADEAVELFTDSVKAMTEAE